ncbi:MAG: hypothetical protein ACXV3F_01035 [Frankiaceae bacterium]
MPGRAAKIALSLALTGATIVVALSTVDLMVTSPGRAQSSGGTLAIGASPGAGAAAATRTAGQHAAGRHVAGPGTAGRGTGRAGAGSPIALGIVDGTGRPGALAGVRGLLPATLAAPEVVSGLPTWARCAHTFLGAAPAAMASATSLAHQVPALRRVRVVALSASLPKPLTARPILFVCEDFGS